MLPCTCIDLIMSNLNFQKKYSIIHVAQSIDLLFDLLYTLDGGSRGQFDLAFGAAASLAGSVFEPNKKGSIFFLNQLVFVFHVLCVPQFLLIFGTCLHHKTC
jgi:hypothetical protein